MSETLDKQRARTEADKDLRRASLLEAARSVLAETALDDIRIADVSARAGVAKGTAYLYFPTKESLFLAVLEEELADLFAALEGTLGGGDAITAEALSADFAQAIAARPLLLDLLSNLHSRLETNLTFEDLRRFKRWQVATLDRFGSALEQQLGLKAGTGAQLLLHIFALAVGLGQFSRPGPTARDVIDSDPHLQLLHIDFAIEFARAMHSLLLAADRSISEA